jgi:hypothetical protein
LFQKGRDFTLSKFILPSIGKSQEC